MLSQQLFYYLPILFYIDLSISLCLLHRQNHIDRTSMHLYHGIISILFVFLNPSIFILGDKFLRCLMIIENIFNFKFGLKICQLLNSICLN
jgi:hypothetical protein